MTQETSRAEFEELARSAGATIAATLVQRRQKPDPSSLVGRGKLDEIAGVVASTNASLVLFDHDLTPSQLRNIEARLPCHVIDRSQLILDIFARHAKASEGQLQVELAQLEYQLPRLGGRGRAMSQFGGGIGTRGPGETQLETDRRKINLRLDHIKTQLDAVRRIRHQQRQRREAVPVPVIALVGYTNAGKSTLFNALTEAGALESARMFATLDPKLRQLQLPSRRKILLSDTFGLRETKAGFDERVDNECCIDRYQELFKAGALKRGDEKVPSSPRSKAELSSTRNVSKENLVFLRARGPPSLLDRYRRFHVKHDLAHERIRTKQA
jgi:GTP-binding protein HflX